MFINLCYQKVKQIIKTEKFLNLFDLLLFKKALTSLIQLMNLFSKNMTCCCCCCCKSIYSGKRLLLSWKKRIVFSKKAFPDYSWKGFFFAIKLLGTFSLSNTLFKIWQHIWINFDKFYIVKKIMKPKHSILNSSITNMTCCCCCCCRMMTKGIPVGDVYWLIFIQNSKSPFRITFWKGFFVLSDTFLLSDTLKKKNIG